MLESEGQIGRLFVSVRALGSCIRADDALVCAQAPRRSPLRKHFATEIFPLALNHPSDKRMRSRGNFPPQRRNTVFTLRSRHFCGRDQTAPAAQHHWPAACQRPVGFSVPGSAKSRLGLFVLDRGSPQGRDVLRVLLFVRAKNSAAPRPPASSRRSNIVAETAWRPEGTHKLGVRKFNGPLPALILYCLPSVREGWERSTVFSGFSRFESFFSSSLLQIPKLSSPHTHALGARR